MVCFSTVKAEEGDELSSYFLSGPSSPLSQSVKADSERTITNYIAFTTAGNHVNTRCFPRGLKEVLKKVEARYGAKPIVNSGYRSKKENRRAGGARQSYHTQCMAADIKVPGINKYALAHYLKSIAAVGGVGTYGCKTFVHVDVGPKRTWHWRCAGSQRKKA